MYLLGLFARRCLSLGGDPRRGGRVLDRLHLRRRGVGIATSRQLLLRDRSWSLDRLCMAPRRGPGFRLLGLGLWSIRRRLGCGRGVVELLFVAVVLVGHLDPEGGV